MPGWTFTSVRSCGSRTERQIKPLQARQHMAQQHLCAIFCFKWERLDHQFVLMFLIMTFLKLQHPCRGKWVSGLQKNNSQNMDCLGSTFPSGSPCLPRDQLCFGDVTTQSAQISVFSNIYILLFFFLHWELFQLALTEMYFSLLQLFLMKALLSFSPRK